MSPTKIYKIEPFKLEKQTKDLDTKWKQQLQITVWTCIYSNLKNMFVTW